MVLIYSVVCTHQSLIKDILPMKRENAAGNYFSFGKYSDESTMRTYPIDTQSESYSIHQIIVFLLTTKTIVKYIMNIQEAKEIRLADYLHSLSYSPVKRQGNNLWYKSPFRQETEASFKVNTELNRWFDFGLGKGGNIIALAQELYRSDHIPYLLDKIAGQTPHIHPVSFSFHQQPSEPSFQRLEVRELTHPALLRYLQERRINIELARVDCKELHCTHNSKFYFAIGFPNKTGGYEVRNQFFKGCIAPKDISHIRQQGEPKNTCFIFEGFMDYLSFLISANRKVRNIPT